jgi:hypothetical protein
MKTTFLKFNPDCNTVQEVKLCAAILRDLIRKRQQLKLDNATTDVRGALRLGDAERFMQSFDTLTQNLEVSK